MNATVKTMLELTGEEFNHVCSHVQDEYHIADEARDDLAALEGLSKAFGLRVVEETDRVGLALTRDELDALESVVCWRIEVNSEELYHYGDREDSKVDVETCGHYVAVELIHRRAELAAMNSLLDKIDAVEW